MEILNQERIHFIWEAQLLETRKKIQKLKVNKKKYLKLLKIIKGKIILKLIQHQVQARLVSLMLHHRLKNLIWIRAENPMLLLGYRRILIRTWLKRSKMVKTKKHTKIGLRHLQEKTKYQSIYHKHRDQLIKMNKMSQKYIRLYLKVRKIRLLRSSILIKQECH